MVHAMMRAPARRSRRPLSLLPVPITLALSSFALRTTCQSPLANAFGKGGAHAQLLQPEGPLLRARCSVATCTCTAVAA